MTRSICPARTYHTGDLNIHDVSLLGDEIWAAVTRFSCLARLTYDFNFTPAWRPWFVSDLVPEDRCHLNGIAVVDGRPRFVTALGTTDAAGAWRENKATGGVLIDIDAGQIVLGDLAMPHSPRWHDGRLWLLNSGVRRASPGRSAAGPIGGCLPVARLSAGSVFPRSSCVGRAVEDPRETHFRRPAGAAALREAVVRRSGGGHAVGPRGGLFRVHRRLRGALRRGVPARRASAHDLESPETGGAPGDH